MKRWMWMMAVTGIVASSATAMAQPGMPQAPRTPQPGMEGRGFEGGMGMGPGLARELNLSREQRDRIEAIHDRAARHRIQATADLRIAELDMHRLTRAEQPDQRAIDAQIDRIASMRAQIAKARVAAMFEVRAVLTVDQREKLRGLREMGPMRGPGMRGPGMRGGRDGGERHGALDRPDDDPDEGDSD